MKILDKAIINVIGTAGNVLDLMFQARNRNLRPILPTTAVLDRFLLGAAKDPEINIKILLHFSWKGIFLTIDNSFLDVKKIPDITYAKICRKQNSFLDLCALADANDPVRIPSQANAEINDFSLKWLANIGYRSRDFDIIISIETRDFHDGTGRVILAEIFFV
jgi:hypothetical protein